MNTQPEILVYTTVPCPFCTRVKALLDARNLNYQEIDLSKDPEGRTQLVEKTGRMTFPQVIINGTIVGGFDETLAADQSGELETLLNSEAVELS